MMVYLKINLKQWAQIVKIYRLPSSMRCYAYAKILITVGEGGIVVIENENKQKKTNMDCFVLRSNKS